MAAVEFPFQISVNVPDAGAAENVTVWTDVWHISIDADKALIVS